MWISSIYSWQSPVLLNPGSLRAAPALPVCKPACTGAQVCARTLLNGTWQAACTSSLAVTAVCKVTGDNVRRNALMGYTAAAARMWFNELAQRFCDTQTLNSSSWQSCLFFAARGGDTDAVVHPPVVFSDGSVTMTLIVPQFNATFFSAVLSDSKYALQNYAPVVSVGAVGASTVVGATPTVLAPGPSLFAPGASNGAYGRPAVWLLMHAVLAVAALLSPLDM